MSEGKSFFRLFGRCFMASGGRQLPAIHSQAEAAEQYCLVLSATPALYAGLEEYFLCWKQPESSRQRAGLTGGISHGGLLERIRLHNGNGELMEMPI